MSENIKLKAGQTWVNKHDLGTHYLVEEIFLNENQLKLICITDEDQWFVYMNLKKLNTEVSCEGTPFQLISFTEKAETVGSAVIDDLYNHRNWLFINLAKQVNDSLTIVWKSRRHSDGISQPGWFVLGIGLPPKDKNQITYHLPEELWSACDFAIEYERSPWDGHSSAEVIERLKLMAI